MQRAQKIVRLLLSKLFAFSLPWTLYIIAAFCKLYLMYYTVRCWFSTKYFHRKNGQASPAARKVRLFEVSHYSTKMTEGYYIGFWCQYSALFVSKVCFTTMIVPNHSNERPLFWNAQTFQTLSCMKQSTSSPFNLLSVLHAKMEDTKRQRTLSHNAKYQWFMGIK